MWRGKLWNRLVVLLLFVAFVPGSGVVKAAETPAAGTVTTNAKDGSEMVWIPGGEFLMGADKDEIDAVWKRFGWEDEWKHFASGGSPKHRVRVDGFWMYKYDVSVAQFRKFVEATGYTTEAEKDVGLKGGLVIDVEAMKANDVQGADWRHPQGPGSTAEDNHPVTQVSWNDAVACCEWAGVRLPTEAEWEYAARGGNTGLDGKPHYTFVWGDELPKGKGKYGNFADATLKKKNEGWIVFEGYDDGYLYTSPVGSFDPNGFGLYDMAGNVCQWCSDWYGEDYYAKSSAENPKGPSEGAIHIVRGLSWGGLPIALWVPFRDGGRAQPRSLGGGFRAVRTP